MPRLFSDRFAFRKRGAYVHSHIHKYPRAAPMRHLRAVRRQAKLMQGSKFNISDSNAEPYPNIDMSKPSETPYTQESEFVDPLRFGESDTPSDARYWQFRSYYLPGDLPFIGQRFRSVYNDGFKDSKWSDYNKDFVSMYPPDVGFYKRAGPVYLDEPSSGYSKQLVRVGTGKPFYITRDNYNRVKRYQVPSRYHQSSQDWFNRFEL